MADAVSTTDAVAKSPGKPVVVGNPDNWQLLTKFVNGDKSVIKSSKAWQIDNVGCWVQTYSKEGDAISDTSTFIPGVRVVDDENGGRKLIQDVGSDPT